MYIKFQIYIDKLIGIDAWYETFIQTARGRKDEGFLHFRDLLKFSTYVGCVEELKINARKSAHCTTLLENTMYRLHFVPRKMQPVLQLNNLKSHINYVRCPTSVGHRT